LQKELQIVVTNNVFWTKTKNTTTTSGYASALGASGPGFNPRLRQGFLCLIFCFVVVVCLLVLSKTHYLSQKFATPFAVLIYLVYILQDL